MNSFFFVGAVIRFSAKYRSYSISENEAFTIHDNAFLDNCEFFFLFPALNYASKSLASYYFPSMFGEDWIPYEHLENPINSITLLY